MEPLPDHAKPAIGFIQWHLYKGVEMEEIWRLMKESKKNADRFRRVDRDLFDRCCPVAQRDVKLCEILNNAPLTWTYRDACEALDRMEAGES